MDAELAEEFSIPPTVFSKEEERLKDDVRVRAFRRVILQNKHLFEGKIVLDVGCGCGFLSLLCAKAGAKAVYAIDDTDIVSMARDIVTRNHLENVIQVFKVDDITKTQLPEKNVDIIVSDWMGYFLFLRSRVEMLIAARDRWLGPSGRMFPDQATLHICGMEDEVFKDERVNFWENVSGFDMSPMKSLALREPVIDAINVRHVVTTSVAVKHVDMMSLTVEDIPFESTFQLRAERNDFCHAFVAYFDVIFSHGHKLFEFSTGPFAPPTQWRQTLMYLEEPITVNAGEEITCTLSCSRIASRGEPSSLPSAEVAKDTTVRQKGVGLLIEYGINFKGKDCRMETEQIFIMRE